MSVYRLRAKDGIRVAHGRTGAHDPGMERPTLNELKGRRLAPISMRTLFTQDREHTDMKAKGEQGFTLIELLIVVAIISIIAAIAVPGLLRARMTGNESSAIASLRTTTSSQVSYSAACGNGAYAVDYDTLADPPAGAPNSQGFISAEFDAPAPILKSGYSLAMVGANGAGAGPQDCNNAATVAGFYATAIPTTLGTTGTRGFAVDTNMTIFQDTTGVAPGEPLTAGANVAPIQ